MSHARPRSGVTIAAQLGLPLGVYCQTITFRANLMKGWIYRRRKHWLREAPLVSTTSRPALPWLDPPPSLPGNARQGFGCKTKYLISSTVLIQYRTCREKHFHACAKSRSKKSLSGKSASPSRRAGVVSERLRIKQQPNSSS